MPENQQSIVKRLVATGKPVVWVAFGNPYVLPIAPEAGTYLCAFSYSDVSQIAAAKAIAGEIEIAGRMPVSIPGHAKAGDGLQIPKLRMTLEYAPHSWEHFKETSRYLDRAVKTGVFRGIQIVAGYRGRIVWDFAGPVSSGDEPGGTSQDTALRLASLSRIVGTASAAMLSVEKGALLPEAQVQAYLPELEGKRSGKLRVSDLMTGSSAETSSNVRLLEQIVSRAAGVPTMQFLSSNLYAPLGMKVTDKQLPGRPELLCSARDLASFAQMLLNRGIYNHRRYFSPATVARHTGSPGWWSKPSESLWTRKLFSRSAFGHISTAGPVVWIDPDKELFVILLASANPNATARIEQTQREIIVSLLSEMQKAD
jgi:CubicO group peptidase (beta-lactamase class C family)